MGGVLALNVEDPFREAQAFKGGDGQILELLLLSRGQQRGANGIGLIEVGFQRGPIVCDCRIAPLTLTHDHVDIHLLPILGLS